MAEDDKWRLRVADYTAPSLKVSTQPATQQQVVVDNTPQPKVRIRVTPTEGAQPTALLKVATPYSVRNFLATQNPPRQDTRAWGTKLFDTINPLDNGRSWKTAGEQSPPNFLQRNLSPTGLYNIGKEIVQGTARTPIELGQTVEQSYRTVQENERLRRLGVPHSEDIARKNVKSKTWTPTGWQKRIFGDKTQSYQASANELRNLSEQTIGVTPSPIALTAGMVVTSIGGSAGKSRYGEKILKTLAKSKDVDNIIKIASKADINLDADTAKIIAMSNNGNNIANLLDRAGITDYLTKETSPNAIANTLTNTLDVPSDKAGVIAEFVAKESDKATINKLVNELSIDPDFTLTPDVVNQLKDNNVKSVKRSNSDDPYPASYSDGTIYAKDQTSLNSGVEHELGHHIWATKLTPEEKALFKGDGYYSKQAVGRQGYTQDMTNSEDFSGYISLALKGRIKEVPEQYQAIIKKYAKIAEQVSKDTGIPMPNAASFSNDLVSQLVKTKSPEEARAAVDALFPDLDEIQKNVLVTRIANSKGTTEITNALEEANKAHEAVKNAVASNTPAPVVNEQQVTEQALKSGEITPQPSQNLDSTPNITNEAPTSSVNAVEGAQSANAVDNAIPVEKPAPLTAKQSVEDITNLNEEITNKYGKSNWQKVKDFFKRNWDPRYAARESDKEYLRNTGQSQLLPSDSLEEAIRFSNNSGTVSKGYIENSPLATVIKKYGADTPESRDFNYYRIAKMDLERRADGRQPILSTDTKTLESHVAELEARFPGIQDDLRSVSQGYIRPLQEQAVYGQNAFVNTEDYLRAATKKDGTMYEFYTPISRSMPEGTARPEINSKNIGSISRQRVLQELDKTGDNVELTFDSLGEYSDIVHKQLGQAEVARVMAKHAEAGGEAGSKGGKFIQTAAQDAERKRLRGVYAELQDVANSLKNKTPQLKFKTKLAANEAKQSTKAATTRAKELLKSMVAKDGSQESADMLAAISGMTDQDLTDVLKLAAEPDIRKTPNVQRIYNNFVKKNVAYAKIAEDLEWHKLDQEAIANAKNGVRSEIADLATDSTTGLQIIRGLDENGNQFIIETTPDMSRLLQGYDSQRFKDAIKIGRTAQAPFRQAFTGIVGNPAFQVKQAIWNTLMIPIISKRGFKVYSPSALKAGLSALNVNSELQKVLTASGVHRYGSDFQQLVTDSTIGAIAAQKDLASKMRWFNPLTWKGFKRNWGAVNELGGKIDQFYRTAAAKAEYDYVLKNTGSVDDARKAAAMAYDTVLPDFSNVSDLVKLADSIVPYTAAGQAGTRAVLRAGKEQPLKTAGILALYMSPVIGLTAYNLSHKAGEDFYKDMDANGKGYVLDQNMIVVLPGAHKDDKTGEWVGVVKVPYPPELRGVVKGARNAISQAAGEKNVPISLYARAAFDTVTGGIFQSPKSPAISAATSLALNKDQYGQEVRDPNATFKEGTRQSFTYLVNQLGVIGKMLGTQTDYDKENDSSQLKMFTDSFKNIFYGAKGSTAGSRYYQYKNEAIKEVGLNKRQLGVLNSVISPAKEDLTGESIQGKSFWDPQARATAFLDDMQSNDKDAGKLWQVAKRINDKLKAEGKPTDPLYDLEGDQLRTVLVSMAKGPGDPEKDAIATLNPWIKDFNAKRSAYFDKIFGSGPSKDYTGVTVPKADKNLQGKINAMKTMPKEQKYQFTKDNPDITDFFAAQDAYQRYKRSVMGLPQFDAYPTASPEVQKYMDAYNSLPKENGPIGKTTGKATSPDRSAWIKSHPKEWAAMTEQWLKQNIYSLQGDAALAQYEGINLSEDSIKDIQQIAKAAGGSSSGYHNGYGKFGYNKNANNSNEPQVNLSSYISKISTKSIKDTQIDETTPKNVKFRVKKLPKTSTKARIKLY